MIKLDTSHLRGDIYGGLTAGVVALPLALAMGVASGLGPIAGLYGAIFVGFGKIMACGKVFTVGSQDDDANVVIVCGAIKSIV